MTKRKFTTSLELQKAFRPNIQSKASQVQAIPPAVWQLDKSQQTGKDTSTNKIGERSNFIASYVARKKNRPECFFLTKS